ncbi:hypothetical protein NL108_016999 [Boleophthalmus pectinirostris]|nr:hypothetical protein NL108_016999 [Boleophthalmus pectinirostris]
MASVSCVLSEDHFLCSICLEVFSGPVTTPCGHSFCCTCINKHWDTSELYFCPVCKEEFSSRPVLKTNTFMLDMLSEFKNKPRGEELTAAESGVLCDMCPDPKLQALKSCLMCQTSYCPLHLQPHLTVPRLQKHQLIAAATDLEERVCAEHARPLELFCRDHSELICVLCSYTEHRDHNTVLLKEQCEEQQKHLQQEIQERRDKVQEILKSVQLSQKNADREMEEGVKFFNDLMECVQQRQLNKSILLPQCESSEPESGVLCDVCPDPKLQALKSCLMCQTSYCPLHLQPHLTVPRLQKHQLIAAVTDLEERVCAEHAQPLELFCRDHSELICVLCSYTEHRDHNTVLLKEQCEEQQKHLQQEIQERRDKVQEILKSVQLSQKNADREMEEGVKFFNDLMECVQQSLDQFKLNIEEKHEEIKTEADELIKGLESEISELEQRRAEMEELLKSDDDFQFVQTFTSVKPAPELQDWTEKSVWAPSYKGRVAQAVSELQNTRDSRPNIKEHF